MDFDVNVDENFVGNETTILDSLTGASSNNDGHLNADSDDLLLAPNSIQVEGTFRLYYNGL